MCPCLYAVNRCELVCVVVKDLEHGRVRWETVEAAKGTTVCDDGVTVFPLQPRTPLRRAACTEPMSSTEKLPRRLIEQYINCYDTVCHPEQMISDSTSACGVRNGHVTQFPILYVHDLLWGAIKVVIPLPCIVMRHVTLDDNGGDVGIIPVRPEINIDCTQVCP